MSRTLGEKLRLAREERGVSISEVAEQTRISALYLQSIENDDYKPLPGGIFNKGFVKSYAKFVGLDEQEALADYARLAAANEAAAEQPLKVYRPEVLTDDNAASSMAPTLIFAGIILALMTGGILFVLNYLQNRDTANVNSVSTNVPANNLPNSNANETVTIQGNLPSMEALKVEFRAATDEIWLNSESDGKETNAMVAAGSGISFAPKEHLRLSYSVSRAASARLLINGKQITLPESPTGPRRGLIEFEINKNNLAKIWNDGTVVFETTVQAPTADLNTKTNLDNTANTSASNLNRPVATPRPSAAPSVNRPPGNRPQVNRSPINAAVRPSPN